MRGMFNVMETLLFPNGIRRLFKGMIQMPFKRVASLFRYVFAERISRFSVKHIGRLTVQSFLKEGSLVLRFEREFHGIALIK